MKLELTIRTSSLGKTAQLKVEMDINILIFKMKLNKLDLGPISPSFYKQLSSRLIFLVHGIEDKSWM